jgi:ubiquitin C-terminal hydrolase
MSPAAITNDVLTRYLVDVLRPLLAGSVQQKRRSMELLWRFVTDSEQGYFISDFQLQRHLCKCPRPQTTIMLHDRATNVTFPFETSLTVSAQITHNRVSVLMTRDPSTFVLKWQNQDLVGCNSLRSAGVEVGSTIQIAATESPRKLPKFVMPSVVLHHDNFQQFLLDILKDSDGPLVGKFALRLLKWLPSMELSVEPTDSDSEYLTWYRLQLRLNRLGATNQDEISRNFPSLVSSLLQRKRGYLNILTLLIQWQVPDTFMLAEKLIPFLCELLATSTPAKSWFVSSRTLLIDLLRKDPVKTKEIVNNNFDSFQKLIINSALSSQLSELVEPLTDKSRLLIECMKHIDGNPNPDPNILAVFKLIAPHIARDENIHLVLQKCIELLFPEKDEFSSELCTVIKSIFEANPELAAEHSSIVSKLLPVAIESVNPLTQRHILGLCLPVCQVSSAANLAAVEAIEPIITVKTDSYCYRASENIQRLKMLGLRNLGCTCYMNAVLQQLFYTRAFCHRILTANFEDEAQKALQYLFSEQILTRKPYCDTQPFASVWRGWGCELINPREQQDAFEFLQLLLDQFPASFNSLFRGATRNTIQAIEGSFERYNIESFYAIQLEVQGFKSVEDSFKALLQSEYLNGNNRYQTGDGELIDARKFARIEEAPPVLVLQLKRFKYDLTTWRRYKVNERYQFRELLDIREICGSHATGGFMYKLTGAVLHSGTAQGGHYISAVKFPESWLLFSDTDVSVLNEADFFTKAFGGLGDSKPCAYLLFYAKIGATFEIDSISYPYDSRLSMEPYVKPEIRARIVQANVEFSRLQTAFQPATFHFVMGLGDPVLLLKYYIRIFCHSQPDREDYKIEERLTDLIVKEGKAEDALDFLLSEFDSVTDIIVNCSIFDILLSLVSTIKSIISQLPVSTVCLFITKVLEFLLSSSKSWRQISAPAMILANFVKSGADQLQYALQNNWIQTLLTFIGTIYQDQKNSVFLNNVDLSAVFVILQALSGQPGAESMTSLVTFSSPVLQSRHHCREFVQLVFRFCDFEFANAKSLATILLSAFNTISDSSLLDIVVVQAISATMNEEQADVIIQAIVTAKEDSSCVIFHGMCDFIRAGNQSIRQFLLTYPSATLIRLITSQEEIIQMCGLNLFLSLFSDVRPPSEICDQSFASPLVDSGLTDATRKEMTKLLSVMFDFLKNSVIPQPAQFYAAKRSGPFVPACVHLLNGFLRILSWFLSTLEIASLEYFEILRALFNAFALLDFPVDRHLGFIAKCYSHFPRSLVQPEALPAFRQIFRRAEAVDLSHIAHSFCDLWPLIWNCGDLIRFSMIQEPMFPIVLKAVFCGGPGVAAEVPMLLASYFLSLADEYEFVNQLLVDLCHGMTGILVNISLEVFEPLFLKVLPRLSQTVVAVTVLWVFSVIGSRSSQHTFQGSVEEMVHILNFAQKLLPFLSTMTLDLSEDAIACEEIVESLVRSKDPTFRTRYIEWVSFWDAKLSTLHTSVMIAFEVSFADATSKHLWKIAREWAAFEVRHSCDFDKLKEIMAMTRAKSEKAIVQLFGQFIKFIEEGNQQVVEFAVDVAIESFHKETIIANSVNSFFTYGIQNMDPDNLVCLYLTIVEGIGELQSEEEKFMADKAAFIAGLRPDLKETLVELFPIQDDDVIQSVLFGQKESRPRMREPSESDTLFEQAQDADTAYRQGMRFFG